MPTQLRGAMEECLEGWQSDLPALWQVELGDVALGFDAMDPDLTLEPWEPIFPVRRGKHFPGMPDGAHMLRAFDGLAPRGVSCVILGQDPYPEPGFATGRAFEAGNVREWRELDKMFSRSVRAYMQLIVTARLGDASYARSFADWPATLAAIEGGTAGLEGPSEIADRWIEEGVLLLNASLTLSRFKIEVDPHQSRGHLPLWRPLMLETLRRLAAGGRPIVFIGFGDAAAESLREAGIAERCAGNVACVLREHPANADAVLAMPNPFLLCNSHLEAMGAAPISW